MNEELRELYQETMLDHYRRPRNFGKLAKPTHHSEGHNPFCGDQVTVMLIVKDDHIADVKFEGVGCAISTASASMMTEAVLGKTVEEADAIMTRFRDAIMEGKSVEGLGSLEALTGVREHPVRIKCATLAWHTLRAALHEEGNVLAGAD